MNPILDMKNNYNLREKLILMKLKWPDKIGPVAELYNNISYAQMAYKDLLNFRSAELYGVEKLTDLKSKQADDVVDKIFSQAYAYRQKDDKYIDDRDVHYKNQYNIRWLLACINEAIEECVIKIQSEILLPDDPIGRVRSYLNLKLFSEWKGIGKVGNHKYYINAAGDIYSMYSMMILHFGSNPRDYKRTSLYVSDEEKLNPATHRLVAMLFIPNPDNLPEVNHKNGVKTCNDVDNLEWCTHLENMHHAENNKLVHHLHGEECSWTKYSDTQVHHACKIFADPNCSHWLLNKISSITGIDISTLAKIYRREIRKDISSQYVFAKHEPEFIRSNTPEQIRQVCEILSDPDKVKWRYEDISNATGVDPSVVGCVYRREMWKDISDGYIFQKRDTQRSQTKDQIIQACELLRDHPDWAYKKISEITGLTTDELSLIYTRRLAADISCDYEFPERLNSGCSNYDLSTIEKVCCYLDKKYLGEIQLTMNQIAEICNVKNDVVADIWRCKSFKRTSKNHIFYQSKLKNAA